MIRLGLRLSLAGSRDATVRLVVTATAVALGVGLLLLTLAGISALHAQDRRVAWLETSAHNRHPSVDEAATDPLWGMVRIDQFGLAAIDRVDVAATGPRSPVPPGIPRLPGPGEYYASPALARLLRTTPADELADRYPGRLIGSIADDALASPDSLTIIVGRTVAQLSHTPGAGEVRSIETAPQGSSPFIHHPGRMQLILAVVAGALLFPVLIFIATATRLAAAQRERRFAAMRLVGATPRQVSVIAAVEALLAAALGVTGGFVLFVLLRPVMARVPFSGQPFFAADLSLTAADVLLVGVGVPLAAAVVAMLALRRVTLSPLGVVRRVSGGPPRAWRLLPLVAGLSDNPRAAFRSVSGLIVALFITTAAWGVIATVVGYHDASTGGAAGRRLMAQSFVVDPLQALPGGVHARLAAIPGVTGVVVAHALPAPGPGPGSGPPSGLVSCGELSHIPALGRCAPGTATAELPWVSGGSMTGEQSQLGADRILPAVAYTAAQLQSLPVLSVYVDTNGSRAAIERTRTALELLLPRDTGYIGPPSTINEVSPDAQQQLLGYQRLAAVAIIASLPIAACSLAVSVAVGVSDRKKPFSLLRLAGTPLGVLRRVVALEAAVPLMLVSVLAISTGLAAADLFLHAQLTESLRSPGSPYYIAVTIALLSSLAIIAATLPLLEHLTGPEVARNE